MPGSPSPIAKAVNKAVMISLWLGPVMTVGSILAAHLGNMILRPEDYVEAPPSISRAIVHDEIGGPFAMVMIPTVLLILLAVSTIHHAYWTLLTQSKTAKRLITGIVVAEAFAAIGMIMLSQYRTEEWQFQHDLGSYILFAGHAVAITLNGIMASKFKVSAMPEAGATLAWTPKAARTVFILSVLYGSLYFGRALLPDDVFFWQRLVLAVLEVVLLTAFVSFLWRHAAFVALMAGKGEQSWHGRGSNGIHRLEDAI